MTVTRAFQNTEELYNVMEELWGWIKANPEISKQLLDSKLTVRFCYAEPDGQLTIDGSNGTEIVVTAGSCEKKPDVELSMKSDVAHDFWLGKLNVAAALLCGKIQSKGPVNRALSLLPAIKPAHKIYPLIAKNQGLKRIA